MSAQNSGKPWTSRDLNTLKQKAKSLTADEIAKNLKRTEEAVQQKAHKEGIKLKKP